jgi:hypothetical protein
VEESRICRQGGDFPLGKYDPVLDGWNRRRYSIATWQLAR